MATAVPAPTLLDILPALNASGRGVDFYPLVGLSTELYHDFDLLVCTAGAQVASSRPGREALAEVDDVEPGDDRVFITHMQRAAEERACARIVDAKSSRLVRALRRKDVGRVRELLRALGPRAAAVVPDLGAALLIACAIDGPRNTELVRELLAAGAPASTSACIDSLALDPGIDFNHALISSSHERVLTPLHFAAEWSLPITTLLLEAGANANARDQHGLTPLFVAAERNRKSIVKLLLAQPGIDVNAATDQLDTPLLGACAAYSLATVQFLIHAPGVNLAACNRSGRGAQAYLYAWLDLWAEEDDDEYEQVEPDDDWYVALRRRYSRSKVHKVASELAALQH